jgi:hypothetical protein
MAVLSDAQKRAIVQGLACFRTPSEVAEDVKEAFGLEVPREQVRNYNPQQVEVAKKWRSLFDATRAAFIAEVARHGITHQAYRLGELDAMLRKAKKAGNLVLAASLLEQAAREVGGMFTNRRELSGRNGGPIPFATVRVVELPDNGRGQRPSAADPLPKVAARPGDPPPFTLRLGTEDVEA